MLKNMGNFNGDSRNRRGGRDFGRRDSFGGGGRGGEKPGMHDAICSDCGKSCKVPFKPTGEKPIYCSECFENHGGSSRSSERPNRGENRFQGKRDGGFENRNTTAPKDNNQHKEQIDKLISKMDIIINLLSPKKEAGETPKNIQKNVVEEKPKEVAKKEVKKEDLKKAIKEAKAKKKPVEKKKVVEKKKPVAKKKK
jgi:CxxC-x17-CxxC domain-containing protein